MSKSRDRCGPDSGLASASFPAWGRWASGLALAVLATPPALAQDGGPIVITERETLEFLQIENVRLSLEIYARRQIDEVEPAGRPKVRDQEDRFRQELWATAEGFLGHPNLVELDLAGGFRFEQEDFDLESTGFRGPADNDLFEFDVSALLLRQSKAPITVFASRSETTYDRQFGGSIDSTVDEYGIAVDLRSEAIPTRLEYRHRESDQTDPTGRSDFDLVEDTIEWRSTWQPAAGQYLTWNYRYDDIDQGGEFRRLNAFERHDGLAIHTWDFGPTALRSNLHSTLRLFKENGIASVERLRVDERLRLRHDRNFETRYNYSFDWLDRDVSEQTSNRGSIGFQHNLFESLVTTGEIGVDFLDLSDPSFRSDQTFGGMHLDYTKKVPGGRLDATAFFRLNRQDDTERGAPIQILDEALAFPMNDLIVIMRQNIEAGSVVVTDEDGIVTYIEGLDYDERLSQDRLEIRRRLAGAIAPGEVVLIDYRIGPEPANTTDTSVYGFTVRYEIAEGPLSGLGLYARYREQNQTRSLVEPRLFREDVEDIVFGVDYDFWRLSLSAEYEMFNSTLSPYDATRLEAHYIDSFGPGSGFTITASYDEVDRTDENIVNQLTYISGRWHQQLTNQLMIDVELIWRDEKGLVGADLQAFEQRLDLEWQYRQTTVYLTARNAFIDSEATDSLFRAFQIGVRREF